MAHRWFRGLATACAVGLAVAPVVASAQPPACGAWEVEYTVSENLRLSDTPMGRGDGVYAVGPGRVVLRFDDRDGQPGGRVEMLSYEMREHFTIDSRTLFWNARVTTDALTRGTPDACGVAEGVLQGTALGWTSPVRGYRTDGTITCEGVLCGKFGAPPPGRSELHIGPGPVSFSPFQLARDAKTFTMSETFVAKTDMPKQTAHVALAGREVRRACVPASSCSSSKGAASSATDSPNSYAGGTGEGYRTVEGASLDLFVPSDSPSGR
jgi:hypothetical protein